LAPKYPNEFGAGQKDAMVIVDEYVATIGDRQQQLLTESNVTEVQRVECWLRNQSQYARRFFGFHFTWDSRVGSEVSATPATLDYDAVVSCVVDTECGRDRASQLSEIEAASGNYDDRVHGIS